ncbi:MAG: glycosyltransferase family 2 protein [Pyrinomonadaceae bacterium]
MSELNEKPEVFIMVPIYNHAPFIERCLRSIINQTYAPAKLLVIDDGSTDGSAHVIERVLRDCPFDSELIVRENRGLCATLNQGFSLSFGKYFAYIGSDDYWLPTFIEERVKLLEPRENAVIGYGNAYFVNENDEVTVNTADFASTWANFVDGDVREMLARVIVPISSTVFYRRSALETFLSLPPSPLELAEGLEQLRLVEYGIRYGVVVTPEATRGVDTPEDYAAFVARDRARRGPEPRR